MAEKRDYYQVLGISRKATQDEIKRAYRALARRHHPDVNGAHDAAAKFREVNEAYEVLSDPEKRKNYDRFGLVDLDQIRITVYGPGLLDLIIWGFDKERHLEAALKRVQGDLETILEDLREKPSVRYKVDDLDGLYVDLLVTRTGEGLRVKILSKNDLFGGVLGDLFSGMVNRR